MAKAYLGAVDATFEGQSREKKVALVEEVTDAVESTLGAPRERTGVVLREVPAAHRAVGGVPAG